MIITLEQGIYFFLILARITGLMLSAPVFSRKEVFSVSKIALIIWMSGLLLFVVPLSSVPPTDPISLILALIVQFEIGLIIGFIADLIVAGIEFAGGLMDTQAGLSVANLLDPSTGRTTTLISLLLKWTSFMIFLQLEGHLMILSAVVQSFKVLPVGQYFELTNVAQFLVSLGGPLFSVAIQLSAPVLLIVFLVDFCFGMLSRVAPQVNVFQLGFQIKPWISLLIFWAIAPGLIGSIYGLLENAGQNILKALFILQSS